MPQYEMRVIPEPTGDARQVLVQSEPAPVMSGEGDHTYRCGACKRKLIENVGHHDTDNVVVKCGKCGKFNEVPPHSH